VTRCALRVVAMLGVTVLLGVAMPAGADGSESCGQFQAENSQGGTVVANAKAQQVSCSNAKRVLRKFFAQDGTIGQPGDVDSVGAFRCKFVSLYDPGSLAWKCKKERDPDRHASAYWTSAFD
jgi:hypothetical protein